MNDKWFNIAMIIVFTSLLANGFVFMLTAFPNGGTYDGKSFTSLHQASLDYNTNSSSMKTTYKDTTDSGAKMSPTENTTFNPITFIVDGIKTGFGLAPLQILGTAFVGLELMILTLANIFPIFATVLVTIVLVMFVVKAIVVAYFAGILIRSIFGGRQ